MPPKKGAAKAKTPAKAGATTADTPATVANAKGKEVTATAAVGRPRRATAALDTPSAKPTAKKAVSKAATAPKAAATTNGKKRGRPAKDAEDDAGVTEAERPKKRGRPNKPASATSAPDAGPAKARGRPTKAKAEVEAPAVPRKEKAPPKKRGRPPKGGETTQVEAEEEAAAEQLEEELVDAVVNEGADEPRKRTSPVKRGRPAKGRGKRAATAADEDEVAVVANADGEAEELTGKQYWLMKAEQEDREETLKDGSVFNAKFTIDDLREKGGPEPWDGVRNTTACKNMKDMKVGDLAFFYASGGKKGRVPGITGIMEIVGEHEPDPSALDENSPFYADNPKMRGTAAKPRWYMVHVEFRKKLSQPVTLTELKKYAEQDSVLSKMQELNAARLSVSKVSEKEWDFIVNELIEGYDDDGDAPLPVSVTSPKFDPPNDGVASLAVPLSDGFVVKPSVEADDAQTTDSMLPLETVATSSRPDSRAGSKKPSSRAGSQPGSRAGNLAPPRATSRARSRTPRAGSTQPATVPMAVVEEEMEFATA